MNTAISAKEFQAIAAKPKRSKYGNKKTDRHGIIFDSIKEANRYDQLLALEAAGEISHLERQGKIYLMSGNIPVRYDSGRKAFWKFDFAYFCAKRNKRVIEDVKGVRTDVFKLKKAVLLACYPGIHIEEI